MKKADDRLWTIDSRLKSKVQSQKSKVRSQEKWGFSTLAIHGGVEPDPLTGAVVTPIYQTSTYVQTGPGEAKGYEYSRTSNPTRTVLEKNLAFLEGGVGALSFASGMSAISCVMNLLKSGDHVVVSEDVYGGTYRLFTQVLKDYRLDFTFTDTSDLGKVKKALKPETRMIWIETPTNPLLKITDLDGVHEIAQKARSTKHEARSSSLLPASRFPLITVDNTFMSPYFQKPLEHGADIVVHSMTKYLGGHSDVVGGGVVVRDQEIYERLKFLQNAVGAVPSPFDVFLTLRGIKTLALRMERHNKNAMEVAQFLHTHPKVERVYYPGLEEHPGYEIAKRQMSGFGGVISFEVDGGLVAAKKFLKSVEICALAESLGAVETLIEHPGMMTHASIPKERREEIGITDGLIRISVGIEDVEDIIADLEQALK
ncbi:cystathionine gamma-synthase [candidate division TA06 bacterium]|nr:cystathionine gamma-synthase [candidate division TA06 bacterium]